MPFEGSSSDADSHGPRRRLRRMRADSNLRATYRIHEAANNENAPGGHPSQNSPAPPPEDDSPYDDSPYDDSPYDDLDESDSCQGHSSAEDEEFGWGSPQECGRHPRHDWIRPPYPSGSPLLHSDSSDSGEPPSRIRIESGSTTSTTTEGSLRDTPETENLFEETSSDQGGPQEDSGEEWQDLPEDDFLLDQENIFNVPSGLESLIRFRVIRVIVWLEREDVTRDQVDGWVLDLLSMLIVLCFLMIGLTCWFMYRLYLFVHDEVWDGE